VRLALLRFPPQRRAGDDATLGLKFIAPPVPIGRSRCFGGVLSPRAAFSSWPAQLAQATEKTGAFSTNWSMAQNVWSCIVRKFQDWLEWVGSGRTVADISGAVRACARDCLETEPDPAAPCYSAKGGRPWRSSNLASQSRCPSVRTGSTQTWPRNPAGFRGKSAHSLSSASAAWRWC